jgi:seryl-tRNA synthetase
MYARIKNDLDEGLHKVKWFARLLSERVRIELTVFRLLHKSEELKKKRDALIKKIGEESYRINKSDKGIHPSKDMLDAITEIDALEPQIKETIDKAAEISRITA